jgi:internalin A
MMAKIPQDADFFNFSDVRAWRDCDDLIGLYHDWEALCEEQSGDYAIDCGRVRYAAAGAEVTVYDGDFDFDEVRLGLLDRGFSVHEYRDAQVWGKTDFRWIALTGDLIIKGLSEEAVKGCIDVIRGVKDSLWDTQPAKDVAARLPQGIYMDYGTGEQFEGLMAFGTSYEKQEEPALKVTAVFMFEDGDAAHDAVDEIEDYMAELKVENIDVVQDKQFVKVTGERSLYPLVVGCAGAEGLTFPDPNLEAAIRETIGKPEGDICQSDLAGLTYLYDNGGLCIHDLTGLEQCVNLTRLNLGNSHIRDITPISNLKALSDLWICCTEIRDLTPLENITSLKKLTLAHTAIGDLSPLSNLTNLQYLDLLDNHIWDISALSNLTGLTYLRLSKNNISDIAPLSNLTSLTTLDIEDNRISDITTLANLTSLTSLYLSNNQIRDIGPLANLTSLTYLDLSNNRIVNINPLANLTSLTNLYLSSNRIDDINPLANLTNLTRLSLSNNQISDITSLCNLTSMVVLSLSDNDIEDISGLSNLTKLQMLSLRDNQISDITPLANLTGLGGVDWLAGSIDLSGNQISDIWPLVANLGISGDTVDLRYNPLSPDSINVYIPQLEARGVEVLW